MHNIKNILKHTLKLGYNILAVLIAKISNKFKLGRLKRTNPLKLNIGCGKVKYKGWINIDIEPSADLVIDVTRGLPFEDNSVDFIYSEHLIEHITFEQGLKVVKEFYRCLKKGVVRIATPDLDYVILKYNTDWQNQDWLSWPEHKFIKTKGEMINISFRWWGHRYLYNEEDLKNLLIQSGFKNVVRCELDRSNYPELCNLETRADSRLILQCEKC